MNPAEIIVIGFAALALAYIIAAALSGPRQTAHTDDPRLVLRRCRVELAMVRRELERIPATREAHDIFAQIDSTERAIDETEAALTGRRK